MSAPWKFLLMMMFAIWGVGLAMTVNGPDKGGTPRFSEDRGGRGLFAPRVEYDEWTPLGHGDPLKNDPTFDYVPPVLERVRYWVEPSTPRRQPPPTPRPHLRPRPQSPLERKDGPQNHPFLTMVDGPKFNLPPSPPHKPSAPYRPPSRPPYRPPPPRPVFTTTVPPTTEATYPPTTSRPLPTTYRTPPPTYRTPSPTYRTPPPTFARPPPSTSSPRPPSPPAVVLLTTAPPTTTGFTTPGASLTTDPLFAHYKQPSEPLQGPMYLIIEGHSKVKTYGAGTGDAARRQKRRRRKRRRLVRSLLAAFL